MDNIVNTERRKFFYDAQISRLLIQLGTKVFAGYQIMTGTQRDGKVRFRDVPTMYGGMSRVVQYLLGGGSDNVVPVLPMISYTVTNLQREAKRAQNPQLIQPYVVHLRARDADGNLLINEPGKYVTIERAMPVPYQMGINLSIWASNTDHLYQLIEQICSVFNPDQEIQISNTPLDWTSITSVIYDGGVTFEDVIPGKNADSVQTATLNFKSYIWLSLPVRVSETTFIHEVQTNIHELKDFGFFIYGDNIDIVDMPTLDRLQIKATEIEIEEHNNQ